VAERILFWIAEDTSRSLGTPRIVWFRIQFTGAYEVYLTFKYKRQTFAQIVYLPSMLVDHSEVLLQSVVPTHQNLLVVGRQFLPGWTG
jgi:hypothetical protein